MDELKKIFASVLGIPAESVTLETSPQNTPTWDSLNAIILVTEMEKAYNLRFQFDEVMNVKNVGDAVTLLTSKGVSLS